MAERAEPDRQGAKERNESDKRCRSARLLGRLSPLLADDSRLLDAMHSWSLARRSTDDDGPARNRLVARQPG